MYSSSYIKRAYLIKESLSYQYCMTLLISNQGAAPKNCIYCHATQWKKVVFLLLYLLIMCRNLIVKINHCTGQQILLTSPSIHWNATDLGSVALSTKSSFNIVCSFCYRYATHPYDRYSKCMYFINLFCLSLVKSLIK